MAQRVHPPVYIDTNRDLARLAMRLLDQAAVAVDTEANSLFAYRERLCLIQISAAGRDYIVDPLAEIDLGILSPVFADPGITKIFHIPEICHKSRTEGGRGQKHAPHQFIPDTIR